MTWKIDDPTGYESAKIWPEIVKWTRGKVLDIGAGRQKTFPHFISVDNCKDETLFGHSITPDIRVDDAGDLSVFASQSMDAVFSSHLLEHIEPDRVQKVLAEWVRVINPKGYLVLYLPDADEYPKVGEKGSNPDHKFDVTYDVIVNHMMSLKRGWDLVDFQKRNEGQEYSLFFVFKVD